MLDKKIEENIGISGEFVLNLFLNTDGAKNALADFQGDCLKSALFVGKCFNQAFSAAKAAVADVLVYSSEMIEASKKVQVDVQSLSAFVNTIGLLGTIGDPLQETRSGLEALMDLMKEAQAGDNLLTFGAGLSVKIMNDEGKLKNPLDTFYEIQQKLWEIDNPEERMAAASGLNLGRAMTKALSADKQAYQATYRDGSVNGIISENTLSYVQQMNSSISSMKQSWTDFGNVMVKNMVEPMTEVSGLVRETVNDLSDPDNGALNAVQKIIALLIFTAKILKKTVAELYNGGKKTAETAVSAFLPEGSKKVKMIEEMTNEEYALEHDVTVDFARTVRKNRKDFMEKGVMSEWPLISKKLGMEEWMDLIFNIRPMTMDPFPVNQDIQNKILLELISESAKYNSGLKGMAGSKQDNSRVINIHNTINCRDEKDALSISAVIRQSVSGLV